MQANNKVTARTRAPQSGRVIICPKCHESTRVFHFSWSAIICPACLKIVQKGDFFTVNGGDK